jgi:hypothetical protein
MALSVTDSALQPRSFSIGPVKIQLLDLAAASGDTSGTFKCDALSSVDYVVVTGVTLSAQPTRSGNSVTLAFADPLATVAGKIMAFGR